MLVGRIQNKLLNFIEKSDTRSKKILFNTLLSFVVRGGSILVGLILIPLTITYISSTEYGIWLTISSIVGWMSFFDIGFGHGLRNKLAISYAKEDYLESRKYISTTYSVLIIISLCLMIIFAFLSNLIDWNKALNVSDDTSLNLHFVVNVVFFSFCLQFILQLINSVLFAVQESGLVSLINFSSQFFVLVLIYIVKNILPGSLNNVVLILSLTPVLVMIVYSLYLFNTKLEKIKPSFKFIDFSYTKSILGIGGAFFVIQIGAIVLFQTNNIIISHLIGSKAVTEFNVVYKLFSITSMILMIVITPYWSAFTEAYSKNDFNWMKAKVKSLRTVGVLLIIFTIILYLTRAVIFRVWMGNNFLIDSNVVLSTAIYMSVYTWQTIHVYLLNGIGKLRIQLVAVVIGALLNIPLCIFMGNIFGLNGVIWSNTVIFFFISFVTTIQVNKIINREYKGIFNK